MEDFIYYYMNTTTHKPSHGMRILCGSVTRGAKDTQEMLDFCAANKIYPIGEMVAIKNENEAWRE